jgi:hypothetical protein
MIIKVQFYCDGRSTTEAWRMRTRVRKPRHRWVEGGPTTKAPLNENNNEQCCQCDCRSWNVNLTQRNKAKIVGDPVSDTKTNQSIMKQYQ